MIDLHLINVALAGLASEGGRLLIAAAILRSRPSSGAASPGRVGLRRRRAGEAPADAETQELRSQRSGKPGRTRRQGDSRAARRRSHLGPCPGGPLAGGFPGTSSLRAVRGAVAAGLSSSGLSLAAVSLTALSCAGRLRQEPLA